MLEYVHEYPWVLLVAVILLGLGVLVVGARALGEAVSEAEKRRKELKRRRNHKLDRLRGIVKLILEEESLTNEGKIRELTIAINKSGFSLRRQP